MVAAIVTSAGRRDQLPDIDAAAGVPNDVDVRELVTSIRACLAIT